MELVNQVAHAVAAKLDPEGVLHAARESMLGLVPVDRVTLSLITEDGKHLEIYDHLGDALWELGEKKEAVEAWKKGVEIAGTTKREQTKKVEVEKKIKEKQ